MITHSTLLSLLTYSPTTGVFVWTDNAPTHRNCIAGSLDKKGYRVIVIDGKRYKAHRLAWFYTHKVWPVGLLDHKDRVHDNNWLTNLREATNQQNSFNSPVRCSNTSGHKGVYWDKSRAKWRAKIMVSGKWQHLGWFAQAADASKAYQEESKIKHGEFYHPA